jgi:hypothetical protein
MMVLNRNSERIPCRLRQGKRANRQSGGCLFVTIVAGVVYLEIGT